MGQEQEEVKGLSGIGNLLGKLSPKGELLGSMEKEASGAIIGDLIGKVLPFIAPMIAKLGEILGSDYIAVIRNNSKKVPFIFVIHKQYGIKSMDVNSEGVLMQIDMNEFIDIALNGGIEEFFTQKKKELDARINDPKRLNS